MKIFSNAQTKNMSIMIAASDNQVLTGDENGDIRLWELKSTSRNSYDFRCTHLFSGHSKKICLLALLPRGRFISASADETFRIWDIASEDCERILEGGSVNPADCNSIVTLSKNLIAIAGQCSRFPAWGCFDVWDINIGECLHGGKNMMHRPNGISLAVVKGYLMVHGYCAGGLSIWKVNHRECTKIDRSDDQRIYSMTASATGEILTGGFALSVFKISDAGTIQQSKIIQNSNVIDELIPLDAYRVLTVDRQNRCAGTLKLWHYLSRDCQMLGNSLTPSGEAAFSHVVLPKSSLVLSISEGQFCIQQFPEICQFPRNFAEIRKNSRILAQAYRTNTGFFAHLPSELTIKIAALTGDSNNEKKLVRVALDHFYKPYAI